MPKVSVIIPVYNNEKYLEECLNSILKQTLSDMEIICVDDGSTDGSPLILDEYARKDSRIHAIHQENRGVVAARNIGFQNAKGDYVGFVDSDDWIESDMYEKLYSLAAQSGADMVCSGYYLEGAYTTFHADTIHEGKYEDEKLTALRNNAIYNFERREVGIRASICCKLFAGDFIKGVLCNIPETLIVSEDKMCVVRAVLEAKTILVTHEGYYHYRINQNSTVHTPNTEYLSYVNEVYKCFNMLYEHPNFTKEMRIQAELYITELMIKGINSLLGFEHSNLLWIDPYWLEKIPVGSRIVLYGGGVLGEKYRTHLCNSKEHIYVTCVDFGCDNMEYNPNMPIESPQILSDKEYDYVVITIKNPNKARDIRVQLIQTGVPEDKILWFRQDEIYWKYALADGLL